MKKEFRLEMEYALENGKCPRCDGEIIENNMEFHCANCDFKFKL